MIWAIILQREEFLTGEVATTVGCTQPLVSQTTKAMKDEGYEFRERPEGRHVWYRLLDDKEAAQVKRQRTEREARRRRRQARMEIQRELDEMQAAIDRIRKRLGDIE